MRAPLALVECKRLERGEGVAMQAIVELDDTGQIYSANTA